MIGEILAAHVTIDGGAPVAAISRGAAVVDVEHDVAARCEQMMEHVLAIIRRPPVMYVLQVARAMHEYDRSAVRLRTDVGRAVDARGNLHAIACGHVHDLRRNPPV